MNGSVKRTERRAGFHTCPEVGGYGKPPYETGFTAERAESAEICPGTSAFSVLSGVRISCSAGRAGFHTCRLLRAGA